MNNYNGSEDRRFNQRRNIDYGTKLSDQAFLGSRNTPTQEEVDVATSDSIKTRSQRKTTTPRQNLGKKKAPLQLGTQS